MTARRRPVAARGRRNPDGDAPKPKRHLPVVKNVPANFRAVYGKRKDILKEMDERTVRLTLGAGPSLLLSKSLLVRGINYRKATLFTRTSKMICPSFSLPAGPPKLGGTCPSSAAVPQGRDGDEWVCHSCYAVEGRYPFTSRQVGQQIRLKWTKERLAAGTFVDEMVEALIYLRRYASPEDGDTNYFRLHDSGDFFSLPYLEAWKVIAARMHTILFWAPTREWVFEGKLAALRDVPANLVIRPSALFVDDLPPRVPGMPAGSSVAREPREGIWECPAYEQESEKSCVSAGCRTCWTRPDVAVNYHPHGRVKKVKPVAGTRRLTGKVRRNPDTEPSLAVLWGVHLTRRPPEWTPREPPGLANFWITLNQIGARAEDFPETEWFALFAANGIRSLEDQTARLEELAFATS